MPMPRPSASAEFYGKLCIGALLVIAGNAGAEVLAERLANRGVTKIVSTQWIRTRIQVALQCGQSEVNKTTEPMGTAQGDSETVRTTKTLGGTALGRYGLDRSCSSLF